MNISESTTAFMIFLLFGIPIYDFYILKKSKLKTISCLSSAVITFVFNFVIFIFGVLIGSAIFGNNNDYWVVVSLILVIGISYLRFKGRGVSKGKFKEAIIKKEKKLSPKDEQIDSIRNACGLGFFVVIVNVILLFYLKTDNSADYYFKFLDPILIGALAFWTYKRLSFLGCLLMTLLFIIGKLLMLLPLYAAGVSSSAGIGMTVVISYFMIKGVIAAYKYNYK